MFKQKRVASFKIKEVFDGNNTNDATKFKKRIASIQGSNKSQAGKNVTAIEPHFVYVITSGLHGDEPNENGDFFRWSELLRKKSNGSYTFETWVDKPVLENHDERKIRGSIVDAWPIKGEKSVDMLLRVDERINPNLAAGLRNGSITGTSMGVYVGHSYCSICGNHAEIEQDWCFTGNTEILLSNYTTKPIKDIQISDCVVTHTGNIGKVEKLFKREINEDICTIKVSGEYRTLNVTINHPVLAIKKEQIACVKDPKQSVCSNGNFSICKKKKCDINVGDNFFNKDPEFLSAGDVVEGDWLLTPIITSSKDFIYDDNILKLLGWYLAEGCISQKSFNTNSVDYSICADEHDFKKGIITACQQSLNYTPRVHKHKIHKSQSIRVSDGGFLADICKQYCGEYSKEKYVSQDILDLPNDKLEIFLKAYLEGDGYLNTNINRCSMETASKKLANQLFYICDKLGLHPNIIELPNEPTKLVPKKGLIIYRIYLGKVATLKLFPDIGKKYKKNFLGGRYIYYNQRLYRLRKVTKVSREKYKGFVYNLSVSGDNSYVANNLAVHNCNHLSPSKLNIKGKRYTGQDGNKYPEKIGQLCYEDNRDLIGVEDSIITLGEPADPKALTKKILATSNNKDNSMGNDRRAAMEAGESGVIHSNARYSQSANGFSGGGVGAVAPSGDKRLQEQIIALKARVGAKVEGSTVSKPEYKDSAMVIEAIDNGQLKKSAAIEYAEKFQLVKANEVDELTPSKAYSILKEDMNDNDLENFDNSRVAETSSGDQASDTNTSKPEEQPTPEGNVNPKPQITGPDSGGGQSGSTNSSKPEEKQPTPDGSVSPKNQLPGSDTANQAGDTNKAAPQDKQPTPKTATSSEAQDFISSKIKKLVDEGVKQDQATAIAYSMAREKGYDVPEKKGQVADQANDTNKAKAEEQPTPDGKVTNPATSGDQGVTPSDAKPEEQPTPEGSKNSHSQFPTNTSDLTVSDSNAKPEEQPTPNTANKVKAQEEDTEDMDDKSEDLDTSDDEPKEEEETLTPQLQDDVKELLLDVQDVLDKLVDSDDKDKSDSLPTELPMEEENMPPEVPNPEESIEDELPPILGYNTELVEDKTSPEDSYYVVSLKDSQLFSISAKQAFADKVTESIGNFTSSEYKDTLQSELNKRGANKVYTEIFQSAGVVLAQEDQLPEDTFGDATPTEEPAPNMNVSPEATEEITNNESDTDKFSDLVLEVASTVIANSPSATADEFVSEMKGIFSSEDKSQRFSGTLQEKIDNKKSEVEGDLGQVSDLPEPPPTEAMKKAATILPKIKDTITKLSKENTKLRKAIAIRSRVAVTMKVAQKKERYGVITDIKKEALRLATLSDEEFKKDVKNFENSLKIASKITKSSDYVKVEEGIKPETLLAEGILGGVPSQVEKEEAQKPTVSWSKGFYKRY